MSRARRKKLGRTRSRTQVRGPRRNKVNYHLQPLLEALEPRFLLTTVTGVDPLPDTHAAPVTTDISAVFDTDINPATVSAESFVVHGMQSGRRLAPPGVIDVTAAAVRLAPAAPFHAGELVEVTATSAIGSVEGEASTDPFVWRFRTAARGGGGPLLDTGQDVGTTSSYAVAAGDLDGDGDLDVFLGNEGPNTVWLHDGSGRLADSGQQLGNGFSRAVVLGDLDGDGDLDAFIGNTGSISRQRTNKVWLNDGGGTFVDSGQNLGGIDTFSVALGDLDGDGDLDAFVRGGPNSLDEVWLNDGNGTFADSGQRIGGSTGEVELGDLDGDGDLDAFLAGANGANEIWLNDGTGTFANSGQILGEFDSSAVALGDLDGDGDLDAFLANHREQGNRVWLNDGTGTFIDSGQSLGFSDSLDVALGDLDGDGDLDAFVANEQSADRVWLNDDGGNFQESNRSLGASNSQAAALADLDADGDLDVLVANGDRQRNRIWTHTNLDEVVDLSVGLMDGQVDVLPGRAVTYTITVGNQGPSDAVGAVVTSQLSPLLIAVQWTCIASPGSRCATSGTGAIDEAIDLVVGGQAVFTATATLDPGVTTPSNVFASSVAVTAPAGLWDSQLPNNTATDTNRIFRDADPGRGREGFAFRPTDRLTFPSDRSESTWVTHADVDGDGYLDVITADRESRVYVFLSNGDGTFQSGELSRSFATGTAPSHVTTGDLDHNGLVDLIVTGGNSVAVLLNQGRQAETWLGFASPNLYDAGPDASSALVDDLDDDGNLDVVVASSGPVYVFLGEGNGSLLDAVRYTSPAGHGSVAAGDVDGDGDLDLIVGKEGSSDVTILLGQGDGTFEQRDDPITMEQAPLFLATGDLDGDGDVDLAVAHNHPYDDNVSVLLGRGDGTFDPEPGRYTIAGLPNSLVIGDVDTDGDLDVVLAHDGARHNPRYGNISGGVSVLLNRGEALFDLPIRVGDERDAASVDVGDLDDDGNLDLMASGGNGAQVLIAQRDANFARDLLRYEAEGFRHSVAAADLNADGHVDLITGTTHDDRDVAVWFGAGAATFASATDIQVGQGPAAVLLEDFDGDGQLDLATVNRDSDQVSVLLGGGNGTFAAPVRYTVGDGPESLVSGDFNADGQVDLVAANASSYSVSVLLGQGDGTFAEQVRYAVGVGPNALVADDFNSDGYPDLVVASGSDSGVFSLLLGNAEGTFVLESRQLVMRNPSTLVADDLNDDGHVDLMVASSYESSDVLVFLGEGDGTFAPPTGYPIAAGARRMVLEDFDGDGRLDLAIASLQGNWGGVTILSGRGDGSFAPATVRFFPKQGFNWLTASDLDADGDLDLALTGPDGLAVLENTTPPPSADFDNDTDVDGDDFLAWQGGFGIRAGATRSDGDADGDGDVDGDDFLAWQVAFGAQAGVNAQRVAPPPPVPLPDTVHPRGHSSGQLIISEIMYHPASDNSQEEFIELFNQGTSTIDLTGWQFTDGVDFVFPNVMLPAGEYLVVAADVTAFSAKYPGVTNVIGSWSGRLSNRGEDIELEDAAGIRIDQVHYSDQGDWAVRVEGRLDQGHRGWRWEAAHDGDGSSLELINPALPNEYGQNWAASFPEEGTPGAVNSVDAHDIAPLVLDVTYLPEIPQSSDPVYVTARIIDEAAAGITATLYYRRDGEPDYQSLVMVDDGQHGDGGANDMTYGATIPPQPDQRIVEVYLEVTDADSNLREWPAVKETTSGERANLLYQVLDTADAHQDWVPGSQPIYYLILTDAERAELADIGDGPVSEAESNAQMNGTLIQMDGTGVEVRYNVGIRNRGGASRVGPPNNYRVNVPHDRTLNGVSQINLNSRYVHSQILGSAIYRLAGIPAAEASAVRVRINGRDMAEQGGPRMFGAYAQLEVINGQFPDKHFPQDRRGNLYRAVAAGSQSGDLRYEGPEADAYRDTYVKETNEEQDDWSDLIHLTEILNDAPDENFLDQLRTVIDVEEWMRFLALDSLLGNLETGLSMGTGDNYWLYCGDEDPRFVLVPHDLDTLMGRARNAQPNRSIFAYTAVPGLSRLLTHADTLPLYYQAYLDLIETVFNPETLHPLLDQVLSGFVPSSEIDEMKQFVVDRTVGVLAQIPREFTITSRLPVVDGYHRTTQSVAELEGTADAVQTRSVLVGGQLADWNPLLHQWSITATGEGRTEVLVPEGSGWRYLDDGSDQGDQWRQPGFDDSSWQSGPAPLGYGNSNEATVVGFGPNPVNKFITTYFRQSFAVENTAETTDVTLRLQRDDGAVVYLNGQEVVRSNLPDGNLDFQAVASTWIGGGREDQFLPFAIDPQLLQEGSNLLAVEIHQRSAIDDDIRLDLSLEVNVGTITGGVSLHPGINRISVQAFDGPDATGNLVDGSFVDIWYDGSTSDAGTIPEDPPGVLAPPVIAGGVLAEDTFLAPAGPAYRITGNVVVPHGVTLTILPGTTLFFEENTGITLDGGRLVAEGSPFEQIRFTRVPGTDATWSGIQLVGSMEDNRIAYAVLEYGVTENGMIGLENSQLLLEHVTLDHTDRFRLRSLDSSLTVRNSTFTDIFAPGQPPTTDNRSEHIWASGIPESGHFIIENNYFGTTKGHNDAIDFDTARRPGPIPVILGNTFAGSGDDAIDLEGDAHVEGNLFMNIVKDPFNTASGDANAISAGAGSEYTVVRNIFTNVDHAVQVKDGAFLTFVNNTVFDAHLSAIYFELVDRGPGRGALVEDSIFANTEVAFDALRPTTDLTVNRSIVPQAALTFGIGNLADDPRLVDPAGGDFRLGPGSPALGTARGRLNRGAIVAGGASITGEPPAITAATIATLHVAGPGITHYRYRVGEGIFSLERGVDQPIELIDVADGQYTVAVIGKNSAGLWQDEEDATLSRTWTVDTSSPRLRINEVLAINDAAVDVSGRFPDLIELYNNGADDIDLSGMSISDDPAHPRKFVLPQGTSLSAGEYLVLIADESSAPPGLHLGFALNGDGEGVYLFDAPGRGAALLDSVQFGLQVPDLAIGRLGHDAEWSLSLPTLGAPNQPQPSGDPAGLRINEWFASGDVRLEDDFVELYNPDPLPVALGGLYLTDDPVARPDRHPIAPLSFVAGGGLVRFLADENLGAGADHANFQLSAQQEILGLFDTDLRPIDQQIYYTQTSDVAQGRSPDGSEQLAFHTLPTPGLPNPVYTMSELRLIAIDGEWAYDASGDDLGTPWRERGFDDSSWPTGPGVLAAEDGTLPAAIGTTLTTGIVTHYFRTHFNLEGEPAETPIELTMLIDDGALVYVNGTEVLRLGLPDGHVAFDTRANRGIGNADFEGPFPIPGDVLLAGDNLIAVEVHQVSPGSSDAVFGLTLDTHATSTTPLVAGALALLSGLRITEIMYNPEPGQEFEFIELLNVGNQTLDLSDVRIDGGIQFTFGQSMLEPGQHVVVAENLSAFRSAYGGSVNVAGQYAGRLSNGGELIELLLPAPFDEVAVLRFEYDDGWYPLTDGDGYSLAVADTTAAPNAWDDSTTWQASLLAGGSPGQGEPIRQPGDMDFDGDTDANDLDAFRLALVDAALYEATYGAPPQFNGDLDGDGDADLDDFDALLAIVAGDLLPGDFDADADVDGNDFLAWQAGFGIQTDALLSDGDADHDGDVDGGDFLLWQSNFGTAAAGGGGATAAAETRPSGATRLGDGGSRPSNSPRAIDRGLVELARHIRTVHRRTAQEATMRGRTSLVAENVLEDLAIHLTELGRRHKDEVRP